MIEMSSEAGPTPSADLAAHSVGRSAVVGYDGSDIAKAALLYAAERVGPEGRLIVVHAGVAPAFFEGTIYHEGMHRVHRDRGREVLEEVTPELVAGVPFETEQVEKPAQALSEVARSRVADEIVVGSRGFGRFRAAIGGVSHALLHQTDRPATVVPARAVEAAAANTIQETAE